MNLMKLQELNRIYKNFIVIFETAELCDEFRATLEGRADILGKRSIETIVEFKK
jgi:hypothetical protein